MQFNFLIMAAEAGSQTFPELDYVEKAKTYIMENLSETLSVKDVARHVNLSPEYFTRLFKRSTGTNIKDFIIDCKIMAAKDLLQNSSLPMSIMRWNWVIVISRTLPKCLRRSQI